MKYVAIIVGGLYAFEKFITYGAKHWWTPSGGW